MRTHNNLKDSIIKYSLSILLIGTIDQAITHYIQQQFITTCIQDKNHSRPGPIAKNMAFKATILMVHTTSGEGKDNKLL